MTPPPERNQATVDYSTDPTFSVCQVFESRLFVAFQAACRGTAKESGLVATQRSV